jgi:hypothetical protein
MPTLTILNHTAHEVDLRINEGAPVRMQRGGRHVVQNLQGPVNLRATPAGPGPQVYREGRTADGLVQNRTIELISNSNTGEVEFRVS